MPVGKFRHAGKNSGKRASGLSVSRFSFIFSQSIETALNTVQSSRGARSLPRQRISRTRGLCALLWSASGSWAGWFQNKLPGSLSELLFSSTKFLLLTPESKQRFHPIPPESYPAPHTVSVWSPYVSLFTFCAHQGDHQSQSLL